MSRLSKAWDKPPSEWAAMVSKLHPATLQAEVAQCIIWDLMGGFPERYHEQQVFSAFAFITGDLEGWGPWVESVHDEAEIQAALDAMGYTVPNRVFMGERSMLRTPDLTPPMSWGTKMEREVDKRWQQFFHRRGITPKPPSRKVLLDYDYLREWCRVEREHNINGMKQPHRGSSEY